uniref:Uncharacterized protein n=1 Tax=Oryza glaberrima TaxID=4538 RepID=I1R0S7_ORYGL
MATDGVQIFAKMPSATELREAGIHLKVNEAAGRLFLEAVSFEGGITIPFIWRYISAEHTFFRYLLRSNKKCPDGVRVASPRRHREQQQQRDRVRVLHGPAHQRDRRRGASCRGPRGIIVQSGLGSDDVKKALDSRERRGADEPQDKSGLCRDVIREVNARTARSRGTGCRSRWSRAHLLHFSNPVVVQPCSDPVRRHHRADHLHYTVQLYCHSTAIQSEIWSLDTRFLHA